MCRRVCSLRKSATAYHTLVEIRFKTSWVKPAHVLDLSESEYQELISQLEGHLKDNEGYCDPNLTIGDLADQLNFPKRRLSQLINAHYGQNFVDFINTYRIEKAKERLLHPKDEKETILEVMYEVGFNSKSSFNTVFKKKTGLTPSQYKDRD